MRNTTILIKNQTPLFRDKNNDLIGHNILIKVCAAVNEFSNPLINHQFAIRETN